MFAAQFLITITFFTYSGAEQARGAFQWRETWETEAECRVILPEMNKYVVSQLPETARVQSRCMKVSEPV